MQPCRSYKATATTKHEARAQINPVYEKLPRSVFKGYETTRVEDATVLAVINDNEIVLDRTPFYAESGGQVGDAGVLTKDETIANVLDTFSPVQV